MKIGILTKTEDINYHPARYYNEQMKDAFIRLEHETEIFHLVNEETLKNLISYKPDFIISIGALSILINGTPISDLLNIPHLAWIIDHPINCDLLDIESENLYYLTNDLDHCSYINRLGKTAYFIPLGSNIMPSSYEDRIYDLVFIGNIGSAEKIYNRWNTYEENIRKTLKSLSILCEENLSESVMNMITNYMLYSYGNLDKEVLKFLFNEISSYIDALKNALVLSSINKHNIHIWGTVEDEELLSKKNIIVSPPVNYAEAIHIFNKAKFVIDIPQEHVNATANETALAASCGAVVLTSENPYLKEFFSNLKSMLFYNYKNLKALDRKIKKVLKTSAAATKINSEAMDIIRDSFTWKCRCREIVDIIPNKN